MDVEVVEILMRFGRATHVLVDRIEVDLKILHQLMKGSSSPHYFPSLLC